MVALAKNKHREDSSTFNHANNNNQLIASKIQLSLAWHSSVLLACFDNFVLCCISPNPFGSLKTSKSYSVFNMWLGYCASDPNICKGQNPKLQHKLSVSDKSCIDFPTGVLIGLPPPSNFLSFLISESERVKNKLQFSHEDSLKLETNLKQTKSYFCRRNMQQTQFFQTIIFIFIVGHGGQEGGVK